MVFLMIRSNNYFSEDHICLLKEECCRRLLNDIRFAVDFVVTRRIEPIRNHHWTSKAGIWIGVLASVVDRWENFSISEDSKEIWLLALDWYMEDALEGTTTGEQLSLLLKAIWRNIPEKERAERLVEALVVPIVGLNGFRSGKSDDKDMPEVNLRYLDVFEVSFEKISGFSPNKLRSKHSKEVWDEIFLTIDRGCDSDDEEITRRAGNRKRFLELTGLHKLKKPL